MTVQARSSRNLPVNRYGWVLQRKTDPSPRRGLTSKTRTCLGQNKNLGRRSRRALKPRMIVLARASSNLTDRPAFEAVEIVSESAGSQY
jgi:hypothetical protein